MQSHNSSLIFLNLTSYFGGIRPIVVFVDKICRRDKTIEVSRNLLVMAPSISYLFHIWIYFSIRFFTMIPNKFKFATPFLLYKGKRNLRANLFFIYLCVEPISVKSLSLSGEYYAIYETYIETFIESDLVKPFISNWLIFVILYCHDWKKKLYFRIWVNTDNKPLKRFPQCAQCKF